MSIARTVRIKLNQFPTPPNELVANARLLKGGYEADLDLADLYHHYYLDCFGKAPPNPDPVNFQYLEFLASTPDFRLKGSGIGDNPNASRAASSSLHYS